MSLQVQNNDNHLVQLLALMVMAVRATARLGQAGALLLPQQWCQSQHLCQHLAKQPGDPGCEAWVVIAQAPACAFAFAFAFSSASGGISCP